MAAGPPNPLAGRGPAVAGILAALLFLAVWTPLQTERAVPPTSDLYTHLSVARHLLRGDGFLTDVTYPLSFAFPFARTLPQPLIHRMPGFAALLTLPVAAAGGDPARAVVFTQVFMALILAGIAGLGVWGLVRRGRGRGTWLWLVLLGASPLFAFAVEWGHDELAVGALLLGIRLALAPGGNPGPRRVGLMAGLLALVRLELIWIPVLWWVARWGRDRRIWLMLAVLAAVMVPWSLRNLRVTGQPFFTLQGVAEHAKDTRTFPGYTVYRGLEPQPLVETLRRDPEALARKAARGLRFYRDDLTRLMPWPWLAVLAAVPLAGLLRPSGGAAAPRRVRIPPLGQVALTLVLMIVLYAPFDHDLRHLIPLLPVLFWELSRTLAGVRWPGHPRRAWLRGPVLGACGLILAFLLPCPLPGWESAAADAARRQTLVAAAVEEARSPRQGVLFFEYSAVPWYADRPGVWSPLNTEVRQIILDTTFLPPQAEKAE
ncbi:MAG: hypothetical protein ABIK96_01830 [bacterium]